MIRALLASTAYVALVSAFADETPNSVQLRKMPPNGGNQVNGPEVVEVLTVNTDAGPVRINASDYDPAVHSLVDGQEAPATDAAPEAPAAPPAPPVAVPPSNVPPNPAAPPAGVPAPPAPSEQAKPVEKFVTKTGKKFFVTDADGKPIDPAHEGYGTEAEAQDAAKA